MNKAQTPLKITFIFFVFLVLANTSGASEDPVEIKNGEISGGELKSLIMETELAFLPRLGAEVMLVQIYNKNLEVIAFGTAHETRMIKLVTQCDLITTITGKQFFCLAYEHE